MQLPIDLVPGTSPPIFRWNQVIDTINGRQSVAQEGPLPPSVEKAVERLITVAKQLAYDNASLQGQLAVLTDRLTSSTEPAPAPQPKRSKG